MKWSEYHLAWIASPKENINENNSMFFSLVTALKQYLFEERFLVKMLK